MKRWLPVALAIAALSACTPRTFELLQVSDAAAESIVLDVFLIGDAGLPAPGGEPVLQALTRALWRDPERSLVVFLGDNIYPRGMPDSLMPYRAEAERIINAQLDVLRAAGVKGIFVSGNHDWDAGSPLGWQAVVRQERYIAEHGGRLASFLPGYGCPGPEIVDIGDILRIIALDTQWWLQAGPKPIGPDSPCRTDSEAEVTAALREALREAGPRRVVVVGHHPVESGGHHGGYFDWPAYLFPPYPFARRFGFADQDLTSPRYVQLRRTLQRAFSESPPLLYAAGHEHNLQILTGRGARFNVVSGAGIYGHTTDERVIPRTRYAQDASGFMRLSFRSDGSARLAVIIVDERGEMREDYSMWLIQPTAAE